jgi:hypothetical protein
MDGAIFIIKQKILQENFVRYHVTIDVKGQHTLKTSHTEIFRDTTFILGRGGFSISFLLFSDFYSLSINNIFAIFPLFF